MEEWTLTKKYQTILFDIDDTLLDFKATENQALERLFSEIDGINLNEHIKEDFRIFNQGLWKKLEQGKISREQLLGTRFADFFNNEFNLVVDNEKISRKYLTYLSKGHQEIEGARKLLTDLKNYGYDLYVVTNGIKRVQIPRLADSHFAQFFSQIFISEEVGFQKPNKNFFDFVFENIEGSKPQNSLIIGDSLTSDVLGGINAGIDTIWFNPKNNKNLVKYKASYTVNNLFEINNILID
ncbi:HAD superfamily hydrolase [Liquorilactobacillus cacaonum DSM 21116]|uniref:HAD superfamily hydrolase n=1 Tax=Liquorilactobacillus cacaonum DSM 21116 TaxID=1423729 RepID=A0A0R2CGJ8_9LACO|nr:HAD superfamily hydrolase [Liquorilactobacillus cacaonum DSM 21116]